MPLYGRTSITARPCHGGIEIGQGIHTKVAQVCAHELGIPLDLISVKSSDNSFNANSVWTGGSATSELVSKVKFSKKILIKFNFF